MAGPFLVGRNGVLIEAPSQRVFEYLADLSRHIEWNPEPEFRVTARPDGPPGTGSVYRRERTAPMQGPIILRGGMGDSMVTMVKSTSITVFEPPIALVFETSYSYNGLLHSIEKMSFDLCQEAGGTRIAMVAEIEALVPSAFIGPVYAIRFVRGLIGRLLGDRFFAASAGPHLSRIKEVLETGRVAPDI